MEAAKTAKLTGLKRDSVNLYSLHFRQCVAVFCEAESPLRGAVEIDESYFGGQRGRANGDGEFLRKYLFRIARVKVYTKIVPNFSRSVDSRFERQGVERRDLFRRLEEIDGLVDLGYKKHRLMNHGRNQFAKRMAHINGIENFWGHCQDARGQVSRLSCA